jgi:hypothetical protein
MGVMPRIARERPKKTLLALLAVAVVLGIGWLAGGAVAGSTPRQRAQVRTVVSVATVPVVRTVTVAERLPQRVMQDGRLRTGRKRSDSRRPTHRR